VNAPRPPSTDPRLPTLADVAELAGVSPKTVSRVVNADANVREATREKVRAAIAQLDFKPNLAARSLAAARSFLIGTIMPAVSVFYYHEVYRGAARACRDHGYHLVIEEFDADSESAVDFYRRHLSRTAYDGFLLPPPLGDDRDLLDALDQDGIRYARIAPATDVDRSASVYADDAAGVRDLVDHLWSAGYRRFGIVTGSPDHAATALRRDSYRDAIGACGGDASEVIEVEAVWQGEMIETGLHAAHAILDQSAMPIAIFCFNDEIAAGVAALAHQRGLHIPRDVAIAGFDDSEIAQLIWPSLTTIRQPIAEMAELATKSLFTPAREPVVRICCAVECIVRHSTKGGDFNAPIV